MNGTWAVVTVIGCFLAFWLARWLRARADVRSTAEGLRIRRGERHTAAVWLIGLSGVLILFLLSIGGMS